MREVGNIQLREGEKGGQRIQKKKTRDEKGKVQGRGGEGRDRRRRQETKKGKSGKRGRRERHEKRQEKGETW